MARGLSPALRHPPVLPQDPGARDRVLSPQVGFHEPLAVLGESHRGPPPPHDPWDHRGRQLDDEDVPRGLVAPEGRPEQGGGGSGSVSDSGGGTTFWLTDAPAEYQAVYVTINEVQVNPTEDEEDGWEALTDLDLPDQFELLTFSNGARAQLGIANLAPGVYNQMRLILSEEEGANYVIDADDDIVDLKVPSGGKTGVKLGNGFEITGDSTDIVLDFSVNKSVHVHPTGKNNGKDKWNSP